MLQNCEYQGTFSFGLEELFLSFEEPEKVFMKIKRKNENGTNKTMITISYTRNVTKKLALREERIYKLG